MHLHRCLLSIRTRTHTFKKKKKKKKKKFIRAYRVETQEEDVKTEPDTKNVEEQRVDIVLISEEKNVLHRCMEYWLFGNASSFVITSTSSPAVVSNACQHYFQKSNTFDVDLIKNEDVCTCYRMRIHAIEEDGDGLSTLRWLHNNENERREHCPLLLVVLEREEEKVEPKAKAIFRSKWTLLLKRWYQKQRYLDKEPLFLSFRGMDRKMESSSPSSSSSSSSDTLDAPFVEGDFSRFDLFIQYLLDKGLSDMQDDILESIREQCRMLSTISYSINEELIKQGQLLDEIGSAVDQSSEVFQYPQYKDDLFDRFQSPFKKGARPLIDNIFADLENAFYLLGRLMSYMESSRLSRPCFRCCRAAHIILLKLLCRCKAL
ncbi:hypothetical protein RFI_36500 [Reticulomyxa filosa]|uniref:t-SNARE coiled-coil homology domain-containing protein n=1 Tax=Reticulomyxa filosa TaxID=46433 RepID=X6LJR0_RETFI|nr:hypothetical protein RFI_36500 [Reticulomyxa filosa]|eukprot:ETO00940.1 hypothetical protein RFI_36500 [Reticulomyxa filosa]